MNKFIHLHCHSHYSLLDGLSHIDKLCSKVKSLGMEACALTEHGNLYSMIQFLREAKSADIKPIIGIEAYVSSYGRLNKEQRSEHHLTLLAQNSAGVRNLIKLSSDSFINGYYYKPRIDIEILSRHSEGIICLSGCVASELSDLLLADKTKEAKELAISYAKIFKDRYFIEVQDNGLEIQRKHREIAIDIANSLSLPVVGTSDCHYLEQRDAKLHDILLCINTKSNIYNDKRFRFEGNQFHLRSPEEMQQTFLGLPSEYLTRTAEIAESVEENYESLDLRKRKFPSFSVPQNKNKSQSAFEYLKQLAFKGLYERFDNLAQAPQGLKFQEYIKRLEYELSIIDKLGFATYFLIINDLVSFMNDEGIPNSARGSACGSLLSYCLRISHIDPIIHGLLFERFLDPSRKEFPDIDIDCCKQRRHEVIKYLNNKYGYENVASICTFNTMAARASIKDVARALSISLTKVDSLTSGISKKLGTTIDSTLKSDASFVQLMRSDNDLMKTVAYARQIEGTARSTGTHAAGIVISPVPLVEVIPLQTIRTKKKNQKKSEKNVQVITQWNMDDLEYVGMLKMDILGLRTLTMINHCCNIINESDQNNERNTIDKRKVFIS